VIDGAPSGERVRIPDGAERRAAVAELVAHFQSRLALLTSRPEDLPKQFAVAAVARGIRLIQAMEATRAAGIADCVSLGLRPVTECLTASLYVMLDGMTAVDHLRGAHVRGLGSIDSAVTTGTVSETLRETWEGPTDKVNWERLMKDTVGPGMAARWPHEGDAVTLMHRSYDLTYRAESMLSIHATAGVLGGHIDRDGDAPVRIMAAAYRPDDGTFALVTAGSLMALGAYFLFKMYGVGTSDVERIGEQIRNGLALEADPGTPAS